MQIFTTLNRVTQANLIFAMCAFYFCKAKSNYLKVNLYAKLRNCRIMYQAKGGMLNMSRGGGKHISRRRLQFC